MGIFKPTPNRFARKFLEALRRRGVEGVFDEANFRIELPDGGAMYLSNAFADYCAASFLARGRVIERYVDSALEMSAIPDVFGQAREGLLPRVRERNYYEEVGRGLALHGQEIALPRLEDLCDDLTLELVYDTPSSVQSIDAETLASWNISFEDARDIALANLRRLSTEPFKEPASGLFASPWADCHDASRFVLTDLVRRLGVTGDPVAMLPDRDHLLVTGADDTEGLVALIAHAERVVQETTRFMTGYAFRLRDDRWERFLPDHGHPAFEAIRSLQLQTLAHDYKNQREQLLMLQQIHPAEETECIPETLILEREGEQISATAWDGEVPALLPRTDVVLYRHDERSDPVPWARFEEVLGDALEATDHSPARLRLRARPTENHLRALGLTD